MEGPQSKIQELRAIPGQQPTGRQTPQSYNYVNELTDETQQTP